MNKEQREKLLEETLNKRRSYSSSDSLSMLQDSENELMKIIERNNREIEELTKGMNASGVSDLKKEIEKDFGIKVDVPEKVLMSKENNKEVFEVIEKNLKEKTVGQDEAIEKLCVALRRPYVVGGDKTKIKTSLILTGSNGTGRHSLIEKAALELKKQGLSTSSDVTYIDMSRYTNSSVEILFLQDMYVALNSANPIVLIENFEEASPVFNRMLSQLVTEGKCLLNKRYVFVGNQLQEASTKLSNDIIDSLMGNDKILVFVSAGKASKLLDVFGTSFLEKIVDKIETRKYEENEVKEIIEELLKDLENKTKSQLSISLKRNETIGDFIFSKYEPSNGIDSLSPYIKKIYNFLVDLALKYELSEVEIRYEDGIVAVFGGNQEVLKFDSASSEREDIQKELDEIVGLESVKDYLLSLEDHLRVNQIRKQKGLKTAEVSKHMVFTGNPGTGKTTIARLISRLMKACGILKQGQLVEVTRADLVGKYVGHTAPLTMQVIQSALGGVLFIDEAYSLYRGKDDSFGLEAIDTLVKAMEDHRDDLIVILAGYSKEMEEFLTANSGLKSRFANIIHFEDYTGEELMKIAVSIAKSKDYKIEESALKPLQEYFEKLQKESDATKGNGRFARNTVEEAILRQSKRLLKDEEAELDLLKLEDFDIKGE